jgi:hypothetical protein
MRRAGIAEEEIGEARRYYDDVVASMRAGASLADARRRVEEGGFPQAFATLDLPVLPDDEAQWKLAAALMDYDPRPALERIRVPTLAVFGGDDPITPVEESAAVFREAVRPDLLQVEIFAGADHRLEAGDPPGLGAGGPIPGFKMPGGRRPPNLDEQPGRQERGDRDGGLLRRHR